MTPFHWNFYSVFYVLCTHLLQRVETNSGLFTSTLETFEETACDGDSVRLHCPVSTMISIQFSQYGRQVPSYQMCQTKRDKFQEQWFQEDTNCLATTSLRVLFDSCQNRRHCHVTASTNTFRQDPCPRTSKYLKVSYKCTPSDFSNVTVCHEEQLYLSCDRPNRIIIDDAIYGRTPQDTSLCSNGVSPYADCRSSSALEEVMKRCLGKRKCAIEARDYMFGNPCPPGISKYLKVSYTCVPKRIIKDSVKHRRRKKKPKKEDITTENNNSTDIPNSTPETESGSQPDMYPRDESKKGGKEDYTVSNDKNKDSKVNSTVLCINYTLPSAEPVVPSSSREGSATGLIVNWLNTFSFFHRNQEKALLYMLLGVCVGIILLLLVIVIKLAIANKQNRRAKLDMTDPAHANTVPPDNHIEAPTLSRTDSIDRIEVVRFEPRSTIARASLIDNGDRSLNHYYG